jgi:hypothetical protein
LKNNEDFILIDSDGKLTAINETKVMNLDNEILNEIKLKKIFDFYFESIKKQEFMIKSLEE